MLLLAVSLSLQVGLQSQPMRTSLEEVWRKVSPSIATIQRQGQPVGCAALIDSGGYFIGHASLASQASLQATVSGTNGIRLYVVTVDEPTQMALFRAQPWSKRTAEPVQVANQRDFSGKGVIAALPTGPIIGQFTSSDRMGVIKPSLRYAPLSELWFETSPEKVAGALVFSQDGTLIGIMNATLDAVNSQVKNVADLANSMLAKTSNQVGLDAQQNFGPRGLTVGYSLGVEVLQRVVEGFRSPERRVSHPSIGAFFRDASGAGAYIEAVMPNSPSFDAGLKISDVVVKVNDTPIKSHLDLAVALFRQRVGDVITVRVKRGTEFKDLTLTVGAQERTD